MTIKNNLLGGVNWIDGDVLYAQDLIDTFEEIVTRVENGY